MLCAADVTRRDQVDAMISTVHLAYGRLDILVNNAAVRDESAFEQLDYAAWWQAMSVCLDGAVHCTQAALPMLKASDNACIINIGGLTAYTGASRRAHVVTAKAGLVGMTRALAHEFSTSGVMFNCIAPGMMETQRQSVAGMPHHHATQSTLVGRARSSQRNRCGRTVADWPWRALRDRTSDPPERRCLPWRLGRRGRMGSTSCSTIARSLFINLNGDSK